jgi:streptogramin lyase
MLINGARRSPAWTRSIHIVFARRHWFTMNVGLTRAVFVFGTLLALTACSGGGSRSTPSLVPSSGTNSTPAPGTPMATVHMTFIIPAAGASTSSKSRSPMYVSPSIQSAIATAYQTPGTPTNVASVYLDLSANSPSCQNNAGQRSCSVFFPAPVGTDYFELDAYSGTAVGTPCGPVPAATQCTGVNGFELSSGTSGGPSNAGIAVGSGSSVSVNIGLQGIITTFSGGSYTCRTGDPAAFCTSLPSSGTASVFGISGLGNGVANASAVLETLTGAPVALDASLNTISGTTCTNGDLFANGIAVTNISSNHPAEGGGGSGGNYTSLALQPCGSSGFSTTPAQGFNVVFPNDQIQATYSGGGNAGNETSTPPYFAYLSGSLQSFPGSVVALNWTSPPGTCVTATTCSAHPAPLGSTITGGAQPGPGAGNGATVAQGGVEVNEVLSPLFAYVTDASSAGGASRDSSNSGSPAHVVVNLSGPGGGNATIYAAQFLLPTGGAYTITGSSGCTSGAQVAVSLTNPVTLTGGGGANPGWGKKATLVPGALASNGSGNPSSSCVLTMSDGFNSVQVWVANSVASNSLTIPPGSTESEVVGVSNGAPTNFSTGYTSNGVGLSGQYPPASSGTGSVGTTLSTTQPNTTGTLQSALRRVSSSSRSSLAIGTSTSNVNPVAFVTLQSSSTLTLAAYPQMTFSIPNGISAPNGFWLAEFDTSNPSFGWNDIAGPVTASNGNVTFASVPQAFTMTGGVQYVFVLFAPGGGTYIGVTEYMVPTPCTPTNSCGPYGITTGPDGNMWFTEIDTGKIGKITTAGLITDFSTSFAGSTPRFIINGPDGNLWFGEEATAAKIGKITTAGVVTEYPITSGAFPYGMTVGPDGNIWFAEDDVAKIGKITTSGVLTEYTTPTTGSFPEWIVTGSDGNLWFTENISAGRIGKITTAGVITEYTTPTQTNSDPFDIIAGPDGNLWFTESNPNGNTIGKITTSGVVTEYTTPTTSSGPNYIYVGPDNNIWFSERAAGKIARSTTSGTITEFPLSANTTLPEFMTIGLDGNMWWTENGTGNVARVTPSGVVTEFQGVGGADAVGITNGPDGNIWFAEIHHNRIGKVTL